MLKVENRNSERQQDINLKNTKFHKLNIWNRSPETEAMYLPLLISQNSLAHGLTSMRTIMMADLKKWVFTIVPLICFGTGLMAQKSVPSPKFKQAIIKGVEGQPLEFTLTNLPNPCDFDSIDGDLELQINFQLGDQCGGGLTLSEKVIISAQTHQILTNYILSDRDNGKRVRINVSYIRPTESPEIPAESLVAASSQCAIISIEKS